MNKEDKKQLYTYLEKAKGKGLNKIYLHWTASRYDMTFSAYHILIKGNGVVWFSTDDFTQVKEHTWHRNTNAIGISLCCALGAQFPHNFGAYPPTTEQIEAISEVTAIICKELNIAITAQNVMTHAEAAALDGYGPGSGNPDTRWDLYELKDYDGVWKSGGDIIRGKAIWYQQNPQ